MGRPALSTPSSRDQTLSILLNPERNCYTIKTSYWPTGIDGRWRSSRTLSSEGCNVQLLVTRYMVPPTPGHFLSTRRLGKQRNKRIKCIVNTYMLFFFDSE